MKIRLLPWILIALFWTAGSVLTAAVDSDKIQGTVHSLIQSEYPDLDALYKHLHANPELSLMETQSAARLAAELRATGFEVTENVGGTGLVGILKNGDGPTVLLRADMDALPVKEDTGLAYASTITTSNASGETVPAMHACGHDVHMTVFSGTARVLSQLREHWQGTLVLIAQPAEEIGAGAKAMLADGLFERFPAPDYALALHVDSSKPAGVVSYVSGYAMANVDSVDIYVKGKGGHGAYPHMTKDPVMLTGQILVALQTIVSRETSPLDSVVVTVGSIHGGTKHNIIPDEVHLQLTVRTYSDESREKTLQAIKRIARGQAISAGLPEELYPDVVLADEYTPALYNDPELAGRLAKVLKYWLGEDKVMTAQPSMAGEDFGRYGRTTHDVPITMLWLGAVDPAVWAQSQETGTPLPSLHSSKFAPLPEPTIKTGVTIMTAAVLELLGPQ